VACKCIAGGVLTQGHKISLTVATLWMATDAWQRKHSLMLSWSVGGKGWCQCVAMDSADVRLGLLKRWGGGWVVAISLLAGNKAESIEGQQHRPDVPPPNFQLWIIDSTSLRPRSLPRPKNHEADHVAGLYRGQHMKWGQRKGVHLELQREGHADMGRLCSPPSTEPA
jgi:hypothetical protein